ncbi:FAD-dependent oxidoreductase [Microcoleus sp. FACHB-1515]|uniref:ferredoxin--NADP reductase n=1 Tax=Cyanophyceae TaxID=3028117 RepID=UPI001687F5E1|nr:FAD-dependent oxidoreductase [Microcoleus sp. FACHB-1515]MBD2092761.1 FAD-dependent oxidoreductase [Microcoleus sp. FACHB-1515]
MMQSLELVRPSKAMDCIATVVASDWLTPTIKSIRLDLHNPDFAFLPGQSVWPKFERDGKRFSKIYSIASSPSQCPIVELCVSRVGWSSAYLQDLPIGASLPLRGPYGLMTIDRLPTLPRLYIVEGSGIAPIKSQIEWLYEQQYEHPVWLVQANPETPDELPYEDLWRSLTLQWPQFRYFETIRPESILQTIASFRNGIVSFRNGIDLDDFEIDICAVDDRSSQIRDAVLAHGANAAAVRSESFHAF